MNLDSRRALRAFVASVALSLIFASTAGAQTGSDASVTPNYFNPAISVIGNLLAVGGQNRYEGLPNFSLRETEVGIQSVVDPYARADFFLSFGESGVEVEEGFITFTSLPSGLLVKAGRMRMSFGKTNTLHLHTLPWPDEPLPVVNLLGGEEGWVGTGLSVSSLIPLPGDTFSELTLQSVRAGTESLFNSDKRGRLAYNAHYRIFRDLTEAANLDFGISYAMGPNEGTVPPHEGPVANGDTRLAGVNFIWRWKPLVTASYTSASIRGELIASRRSRPGLREDSTGWFLSGEYQLDKRWFAGVRIESSDRADDASKRDDGQALLLTFWPTEFSQLRGELRRRRYDRSYAATEVLLQLQFAIGAHGAHPF